MSGSAGNAYLYGANGNPASVTAGGNLGTQLNYDKIINIGRLVLRTGKVTRLPDVPASMVMVFNPTGNSNVWWAGFDTDAPQVNVGMPIPPGTSVNLSCTDTNQLSFIPETDGNQIYVLAFGSGTSVPITPSNPPVFTNTPPVLSPLSPATNGATNVATFSPILIQSSAELDSTTVTPTTVTVSPTMTGTVSIDSANDKNILIYPTASLHVSTTYTITVTTGVQDLNANALASNYTQTFTTASTAGTPDTTPPTVFLSNPIPLGQNFNPAFAPTITFSEAIALPTVNAGNVTAFITNNNQQINGLTFTLSQDQKTLTINNMNLQQSTNYQINIMGGASGLTDLVGNHFATPIYSIPFATSAPPGTLFYSVSGNDYDTLQDNSSYVRTSVYLKGSRSLLIGKVPINYTFILKRVGSPTGTVHFTWERKANDGFYDNFRQLGSISASSVSSTANQTITLADTANTNALQQYDLISIVFQSGDSSNYILAKVSNYDAFDADATCNLKTNSNDNDNTYTTVDVAGTITTL